MTRTVRGKTDHVVVVGAGFAGLSAALHLAGRGREVTVVEREDWPGGRAGRRDIDGYRIDTGPTVLTMPDIIDVHTDADAMATAITQFAGSTQAAGYRQLRNWLHQLYQVEFDGFIGSNFESPLSLLNGALARLTPIR